MCFCSTCAWNYSPFGSICHCFFALQVFVFFFFVHNHESARLAVIWFVRISALIWELLPACLYQYLLHNHIVLCLLCFLASGSLVSLFCFSLASPVLLLTPKYVYCVYCSFVYCILFLFIYFLQCFLVANATLSNNVVCCNSNDGCESLDWQWINNTVRWLSTDPWALIVNEFRSIH